jgi:hypothetical protein
LRGVEERGAHADGGQRIHLVLHQGDEGRDHHARARPHQRGDLVAERLAAARRHEHERVAALHDAVDDGRLLAAERLVAEDPVQDLERGSGGGDHDLQGTRTR